MGNLVNTLAFPVPPRDLSVHALRAREGHLVFLTTSPGSQRIPAIHIRRPNARFTVIYSHGNAEDVGLSLAYLDMLVHVCECSVFAYEYPGYSISEGEPSERGVYQAINAAYKYLLAQKVAPADIVVFGRSLGTGPSVDLCARAVDPTVAGCILLSLITPSRGDDRYGCILV